MISEGTLKQVKVWVPLLAFTAGSWYTYKKRENIQEAALFGGLVALLAWLFARQIASATVSAANAPGQVYINPDNTAGTGTPGGAAQVDTVVKAATKEIFDDVTSSFSTLRNSAVYQRVSYFSNSQLEGMYNEWNRQYFSTAGKTLTQAMQEETYWSSWGTGIPLSTVVDNILTRLKSLGRY